MAYQRRIARQGSRSKLVRWGRRLWDGTKCLALAAGVFCIVSCGRSPVEIDTASRNMDRYSYDISSLSGKKVTYDQTLWPAKNTALSSTFGPRLKASNGFNYDFHTGIDIPLEKGGSADVVAVADGKVHSVHTENENNSPYPSGGNVIVLEHQADTELKFHGKGFKKWYSFYMHLGSMSVQKGQELKAGESIGTIGHSGIADSDHLHFEARVGTPCSREWQESHPKEGCSKIFGSEHVDPHVHPLLFLPYEDKDSLQVAVLQQNPLKISIRLNPDDLDFNRVSITDGQDFQILDLNERTSIDPDNPDNAFYGNAWIFPAVFKSEPGQYRLDIEFRNFSGFDSIEVTDVWGKGLRFSKSESSE